MANDHARQLRSLGVRGSRGLSAPELTAIETRFGFEFPADLRELLLEMLPEGERWPDWRRGVMRQRDYEGKEFEVPLDEVLDGPRTGILFDVEHNKFWLKEWGARPPNLEEANWIVSSIVASAPRLVPVYAHRFIACEPRDAGNPVFSVHQTDIIVYGRDLGTYLDAEFGGLRHDEATGGERRIRFWTRLVT